MKAGRPTVYQDNYPEELVDLMSKGYLDVQIYAKWDISRDTFYRWLNEKEELKEAHNRGMAKCESWYIVKAQQAMEERDDKGFKYYIALMNNKFGWEKGSKGDGGTTNNIQIGSLNVLQRLGREDLIKDIQLKLDKHADIIDAKFIEQSSEEDKSE